MYLNYPKTTFHPWPMEKIGLHKIGPQCPKSLEITNTSLGKVVILYLSYFCLYDCSCDYLILSLPCKDCTLNAFLFYLFIF